jgi:flagellar basal body-associated protein FliL
MSIFILLMIIVGIFCCVCVFFTFAMLKCAAAADRSAAAIFDSAIKDGTIKIPNSNLLEDEALEDELEESKVGKL